MKMENDNRKLLQYIRRKTQYGMGKAAAYIHNWIPIVEF